MIEKHLMKLRRRDVISVEEEAFLREAFGQPVRHPADHLLIPPMKTMHSSTLLLDGFVCRYKDLSQGQRQITELHVPGDFVDLHSFTLKHLDHAILTLTPCRVAEMSHTRLEEITARFPHLARVYWFTTNLDAAIHREWEVSLGRRMAVQRTAHLFCELQVRLGIVGLADESGYALPITQAVLAECLGLTSVHVNRVLRELRERGLVELRGGRVWIQNLAGLQDLGEFDPAYLYLDRRGAA